MSLVASPNLATPIVEQNGTLTRYFYQWLVELIRRVGTSATRVQSLALTGQSAAIALTTLVASANEGPIRVSWHLRVTTAATSSSSVAVTITTTEGGVTCTQASAAYTGNATNAPQSGSVVVRPDAGTLVSYSVAYASSGATAMQFAIDLVAEGL